MEELIENVQELAKDPGTIDEFLHWFAQWVWVAQEDATEPERNLFFNLLHMTYLVGDGTWDDDRFVREVVQAVPGAYRMPTPINSSVTFHPAPGATSTPITTSSVETQHLVLSEATR